MLILAATVLFLYQTSYAQDSQHTISGYIKDVENGETLIGANIYLKNKPGIGTTANNYGFYSLTLAEGEYTLVFSYLGFQDQEIAVKHRSRVKGHGQAPPLIAVVCPDAILPVKKSGLRGIQC